MFELIELLYTNNEFLKYFGYSILILVTIFLIVLFLGFQDIRKRRNKNTSEIKKEDISFDNVIPDEELTCDVTFEIPSLTKNLEEFKKSIESAIQNDELDYKIYKQSSKETKKNIILDKDKIESTHINIDN